MTRRWLTPSIAQRVQQILTAHMEAAAAAVFGVPEAVPTESWQLALRLGLVDKAGGDPLDLYTVGVLLAHADQASARPSHYGTTASEFVDAIRRDPVPLSPVEEAAAQHARHRGAQHLRGLGNRIGATVGSALIEADGALAVEMRGVVNDALSARYGDEAAAQRMAERAVAQGKDPTFYDHATRQTVKRLESDLGHATQDWSRDWARVAQTEAERALQEGMSDRWAAQAQEIAEATQQPVRRIVAYKIPRPDACKHCRRLHLEGGYPRLFHLDELVGNGDNVGRKAAAWRPGVGPVHPYCACQLVKLPAGIRLPSDWTSGQAAPSVVDSDGRLVLP